MDELELAPTPFRSLTTRLAFLTMAMIALMIVVVIMMFSLASELEESHQMVIEARSTEAHLETLAEFEAQSDESLQHIRNTMFLLLLVGGGICVITVASLVNTTRRLRGLSLASAKIANGDFEHRAPHDPRGDEISILGKALNAMVQRIHKTLVDQNQANQNALTEHARASAIFEATAEAIVTLNEAGEVTGANLAAARLFGREPEQLEGRYAGDLLKLDATPIAMITRASAHEPIETEGQALAHSGDAIPVYVRASSVRHEGERIGLVVLHDRRTEAREEAERNRLLGIIRELASQLSSATAELLATSSQQHAGTLEQMASVSQTVATVDEVTATSEQSAERVRAVAEAARRSEAIGKEGQDTVAETTRHMELVRNNTEELARRVVELAENASQIATITATVNELAEQTNLLALNAAIEAARAGEHGRGFSVVAAEIKALARQSKGATNEIQTILATIHTSTREAIAATEASDQSVTTTIASAHRAGETIDVLSRTLSETARAANQILASSSQQAIGISQINEAMSAIESVVQQHLAASGQAERALGELTQMVDRLEELLEARTL
ncbi:methyl-accepting chemotaxis protein [Lujinxingia vulgaris]|nr:methyl-accepting chemotaxis protein [Lujinxingia vulgaris]